MTAPIRIQRKRVKGWRMPRNTVYVGRPTVFGNTFTCWTHGCVEHPCSCCSYEGETWCCLKAYREYVMSGIEGRPSYTGSMPGWIDGANGYPIRNELVSRLPELRGKNLCCWCPLDRPCHADVLLELANK